MKHVTQTILTAPGGDCFPACLASILELPLADVPNFQGTDWWLHYHTWLDQFGLTLITTGMPKEEALETHRAFLLPGYTIIAVDSPRFSGNLHAVVAKDGEIVWDPHPDSKPSDYSRLVCREVSHFAVLDAGKSILKESISKEYNRKGGEKYVI